VPKQGGVSRREWPRSRDLAALAAQTYTGNAEDRWMPAFARHLGAGVSAESAEGSGRVAYAAPADGHPAQVTVSQTAPLVTS
jgi:hypothetical protein